MLEEGAFSGTIWPDDRDPGVSGCNKRDIFQGINIAFIGMREILGLNYMHGVVISCSEISGNLEWLCRFSVLGITAALIKYY